MLLRNRLRGRRGATLGSGLATMAGVLAAATPAVADAPLLAQGAAGPAVARVQNALHIVASGRFDSATKQAVVDFQRRDALLIDGVVGPQTWGALFGIAPRSTMPASSVTPAASTTTSTSSSTTSTSGGGAYSIPSGIVSCESGGNYSAVNSNSGAGGAYQILPSTWHAYGGQGLPQDASPSEQDRIAGEIYAHQGASAWSC
jgi:hypothetical protein